MFKKTTKLALFISILALVVVQFSSGTIANQAQKAKLNQILAEAYLQGDVLIQPIKRGGEEFWQASNSYSFANLLRKNSKEEFRGGEEYVMERLDTGGLYKLAIASDSNLLKKLQQEPVILEKNIRFTGAQLEAQLDELSSEEQSSEEFNSSGNGTSTTALFADGNLQKIRKYLDVSQSYEELLKTPSEKIIAFVDSGFLYSEKYAQRLKANEIELNGQEGTDDDQNGYVDDFYGWNFLNDSNRVGDENGHGTHLVGVGLALSNAKVLPVQVLDAQNNVNLDRLLAGITYAMEQKADVINLSIGSGDDSVILKKLLAEAETQGITVVAAAGNYSQGAVLKPAAYASVLGVGAINTLKTRAYYSNYGVETDFSYYGQMLSLGTNPNFLVTKIGTSQAAAGVSAIVSTLKSYFPEKSSQEITDLLRSSGEQDNKGQIGTVINLQSLADKIVLELSQSKAN